MNIPLQTAPLRIAALVPAFNEEPVIGRTLDALIGCGFSRSDVYVADDCSLDRTAAIACAAGVHVHRLGRNGGKAAAQEAAIRRFLLLHRYDWVVFLDGDTLVDGEFLAELRKAAARDAGVGLFVGQVRSFRDRHLFSASRANDYTFGQDIVKAGQHNFGAIFVSPGCASMYSSRVLRKIHLDGSTLAEDMDLTIQVHRVHERVVYLPSAIVNTQDPATLHDYHKQLLRWYRGFWQVVVKHRVFGWRRKQMVDAYMIYIVIDAFVCNRFMWLAMFAITQAPMTAWMLTADALLALAISGYSAIRTRRWDVILKLPIYYWLGYLNLYAFMRGFVEIVVQRRRQFTWNKARRYEFN